MLSADQVHIQNANFRQSTETQRLLQVRDDLVPECTGDQSATDTEVLLTASCNDFEIYIHMKGTE
jgi:hypothetical protein